MLALFLNESNSFEEARSGFLLLFHILNSWVDPSRNFSQLKGKHEEMKKLYALTC